MKLTKSLPFKILSTSVLASVLISTSVFGQGAEKPPQLDKIVNKGYEALMIERQKQAELAKDKLGYQSPDFTKPNAYQPNEKVRIIVELSQPDKAEVKSKSDKKKTFKKIQNEVISKVNKARAGNKIKHRFFKGFNGFSMETEYKNIEEVSKIANVQQVHIAKTYKPSMSASKDLVQAQQVWENYGYEGEGLVVAVVDSGLDYTHQDMTLTTEGAEEAKWTKSSIQDRFSSTAVNEKWYTNKVPTGYDWADMDDNVIPAESTGNDHGIHVAGTVGANGNENNEGVKGVAPGVQLIAEKVFSDESGAAYEDDIIAGIEHAVELEADVINLSLGSDAGWVGEENDPVQKTIKQATEKGTLVVAAGGNAAYSTMNSKLPSSQLPYASNPDIGTVGEPGVSPYALSVASYENNEIRYGSLKLSNEDVLPYQDQTQFNFKLEKTLEANTSYDLVYVGEGRSEDYTGLDVNGKIVIVQPKVPYAFYSYAQNYAQRNGARAVILVPPPSYPDFGKLYFSPYFIPAATTSKEAGQKAIEQLQKGERITFKLSDGISLENPNKGEISSFSAYGAPHTLDFKPEISAPGGNIYSTISNNEYEVMSGTSMASPHVAGGAALVLQSLYEKGLKQNQDTVLKAKLALMNTSAVQYQPESSVPYSPRKQGAGLMQIESALSSPVLLKEKDAPLEQAGSVSLKEIKGNSLKFTLNAELLKGQANDFTVFKDHNPSQEKDVHFETDGEEGMNFGTKYIENSHLRENRTITITNSGKEDKTFKASIEFTNDSVDASKNGVELSLSKKIKLHSGKTKKANAFLTIPKTAEEGVYEGYVHYINEEDPTEKYKIPFAVNVVKAVEYDVYVDLLKDKKETKEFDLDSDGKVDESHQYLTLSSERIEKAAIKVNGKKVSDQKGSSIFVNGKEKDLKVSINLPKDLEKESFVEGFVRLVPKNKEIPTLTMPYMGFYGEWDKPNNLDPSPWKEDAFLGYTVLWDDLSDFPLGYDYTTGTFDLSKITMSPNFYVPGVYSSFTALRNLAKTEMYIEDSKGKLVQYMGDFSEYTGTPWKFKKNIMGYNNFSYGGYLWDMKDSQNKTVEDGTYQYVIKTTLDYPGAEPQENKIPINIDSIAPTVSNIKVEPKDGQYKISFDATDNQEGSGYYGAIVWVNGMYKPLDPGETSLLFKDEPKSVVVMGTDYAYNQSYDVWGDPSYIDEYMIVSYFSVYGSDVNEENPAQITGYASNRVNWKLFIENEDSEVIDTIVVENEHTLREKWSPKKDLPNGEYTIYAEVETKDGFKVTTSKQSVQVTQEQEATLVQ
jgi:subtilisin family serine protease